MKLAVIGAAIGGAVAIDNGKGVTPPLGWRSWNLYGANVDQQLIMSVMDGMVVKNLKAWDGNTYSLFDLGFRDVGLDDNWQACGSYGPNKYTFHNANGFPIVNRERFPNFLDMTDHAHALNLTSGWYGNNCICSDHISDNTGYYGDVDAVIAYGFDSIKLDGCGKQLDLQLYADLFNATGKSILMENCHWGGTVPNATWCPWNYFRSSGDIRASYGSIVSNLQTTVQWSKSGLSQPGCWAYPDMLEVGCAHGPGGPSDPGLSFQEARSHFAAWCIVSSPLILSHDVNNATITQSIVDIISNTESLAVNQAWAGYAGGPFKQASETVTLAVPQTPKRTHEPEVASASQAVPAWQYFNKPVSATEMAVLLMNHGDNAANLSLTFTDIPGLAASPSGNYKLRDLHNHADLGSFSGSWSVANLASHDSAFIMITPA